MPWLDALFHWAHVVAAVLWVGGGLFASLVLQPGLRAALAERERLAVYREVGGRLVRLQWASWAALAVTGVWNAWRMRAALSGPYGAALAVKLSLIALMVALTLAHSRVWGPALLDESLSQPKRAALARHAARWGRVNGLVMLAILLCAALMRHSPF